MNFTENDQTAFVTYNLHPKINTTTIICANDIIYKHRSCKTTKPNSKHIQTNPDIIIVIYLMTALFSLSNNQINVHRYYLSVQP